MINKNESRADSRQLSLPILAFVMELFISFCFGVLVFNGRTECIIAVILVTGLLFLSLLRIILYLGNKRKVTAKQMEYKKKWHYEKKCTELPNGFLAKWSRIPYLNLDIKARGRLAMALPVIFILAYFFFGFGFMAWKGFIDNICYHVFEHHAVGTVENVEDTYVYRIIFDEEVDGQAYYEAQTRDNFDRDEKIGTRYIVMFNEIETTYVVGKKLFDVENFCMPIAGVILIFFVIFGRWIIPVLKYYYLYWDDRFSQFLMKHSNIEQKRD